MIDDKDKQTIDLLGKKRAGRPSSGKAMSVAQRVAKHRREKAARREWGLLLKNPADLNLGELLNEIRAQALSESPTMPYDLFALHLDELRARHRVRLASLVGNTPV